MSIDSTVEQVCYLCKEKLGLGKKSGGRRGREFHLYLFKLDGRGRQHLAFKRLVDCEFPLR